MSAPPPPPPPANHWHAARYSSVMQTPARQSALLPLNHLYAPPHARYSSQGGHRSHETNTGSARTADYGHAKSPYRKSHRRKDRPKKDALSACCRGSPVPSGLERLAGNAGHLARCPAFPAFSCPTEWITNCPGFLGCPH
ncbi:hypothetical protein M422DRAFT_249415 [Sphaerobolus stellatus SS14]|uniref:Uncharacterized protein n=1 Tax=Sphaerobolus stellatus (strain SS14) TaxID=990650 RepID=A0A0C9W4E6_SPHS4|nr:hypothetical protein M422DRAFT_249415 [Sphaerobolus stellatus SS14]